MKEKFLAGLLGVSGANAEKAKESIPGNNINKEKIEISVENTFSSKNDTIPLDQVASVSDGLNNYSYSPGEEGEDPKIEHERLRLNSIEADKHLNFLRKDFQDRLDTLATFYKDDRVTRNAVKSFEDLPRRIHDSAIKILEENIDKLDDPTLAKKIKIKLREFINDAGNPFTGEKVLAFSLILNNRVDDISVQNNLSNQNSEDIKSRTELASMITKISDAEFDVVYSRHVFNALDKKMNK